MSAISGALMWVAKRDSGIKINELSEDELKMRKKEVSKSISIIATIRQRFLDGYYTRENKVYSDTIRYTDEAIESEMTGKIVGISLGDETVVLHDEGDVKNKKNFEKYYNGVRGKIHLILETPEARISIDVSKISEIESRFGPKEIIATPEAPQDPILTKKVDEIYKGVLARAMEKQGAKVV